MGFIFGDQGFSPSNNIHDSSYIEGSSSFGIPTERLGSGSFGQVYRTDKNLIVKEIKTSLIPLRIPGKKITKPTLRVDFTQTDAVREIACLGLLKGEPNVIQLLGVEFGQNVRVTYLNLEEGGATLADFCTTKNPNERQLVIENFLHFFRPTAEGMKQFHTHNIIHRDFKPENVIQVVEDGIPSFKVVDFGLSRINFCPSYDTGRDIYSETHRPPEFFETDDPVFYDFSADIWALGVTIFELYKGTDHYFDVPDREVYEIIDDFLDNINNELSIIKDHDLRALIKWMLSREPGERPDIFQVLNHNYFIKQGYPVTPKVSCFDRCILNTINVEERAKAFLSAKKYKNLKELVTAELDPNMTYDERNLILDSCLFLYMMIRNRYLKNEDEFIVGLARIYIKIYTVGFKNDTEIESEMQKSIISIMSGNIGVSVPYCFELIAESLDQNKLAKNIHLIAEKGAYIKTSLRETMLTAFSDAGIIAP